jgi:hypothetical protein
MREREITATIFAVAISVAGPASWARVPPPPPPLTNEERVIQSEYVVVGEAQRLVYVETDPKVKFGQLEFDSDSPSAPPHRRALIEVKIIDVLCRKESAPSGVIKVYLPGDSKSASLRRSLYLDKQLIYFLRRFEVQTVAEKEFRYWFIRGPRDSGAPIGTDQLVNLQPHIDKHCTTRQQS